MNALMSCIMVTRNRRRFVPLAIRLWMEQSYTPRELIIVSDGEPIDDLVPRDYRIRHIALRQQLTIGAKRNIAITLTRGEMIAIWDDDDWHGPHRLLAQATALRRGLHRMCGTDQLNYADARTEEVWRYEFIPGRRSSHYLCGQTMCFTRDFWEERAFPNASRGEDNAFMAQRGELFANIDSDSWYVALMHDGNTVARSVEQRLVTEQWRRLDVAPETITSPMWWQAVRQP